MEYIIKHILEFWRTGAYTQAASLIIAIFTLIIFFKKWKKGNSLNVLIYFIALYVLCGLGTLIDVGTGRRFDPLVMNILIYMDLVETVVELIVFSIYISSSVANE